MTGASLAPFEVEERSVHPCPPTTSSSAWTTTAQLAPARGAGPRAPCPPPWPRRPPRSAPGPARSRGRRGRPRAPRRPRGSRRARPRTPTESTLLPLARTASAAPRSSTIVAARAQREGDPVLLRAQPLAGADEERAHVVAGEDRVERCRRARVGHDDVRARPASRAAPPRPCSPCRRCPRRPSTARTKRQRLGRHVAHDRDAPPARVEQALDVAEQHDQVRVDERRDHRRELVVVAELDLLDRHRVVLVEDRHRARLEQRAERGAGVVGARRGRPGRRASAAPAPRRGPRAPNASS